MLAGAPLAQAQAAGVLIHGRDQGPEVMLDVASRLALDRVAYVLPAAAERSWYPGRYFDPLETNEPHVSWSLVAFDAAIRLALDAGFPPERIVLGGFSQGACLLAELMAREPRPVAGVGLLTGTLLGPDGSERRPETVSGFQMFCASSEYDSWVPLSRARSTAAAFSGAGWGVEFEVLDDREHHVSDPAVAGLRGLFEPALSAQ